MTATANHLPELRSAAIAGTRQAWRECGEGPGLPLVLLHGIGSNSRSWQGQFAHFGGARRVIAWNAPGYAGSDPLPVAWPQPGDYAAALLALLDHLGINRFVLVGQSLGAIMAASTALRVPARVAAVILASPASGYGLRPGDDLPEKVQQRLDDLAALGPSGLADRRARGLLTGNASAAAHAIVHRAMSEIQPAGYLHATRLLATSRLADDTAKLAVPGLVVWGAQDKITPPAGCRLIAGAFPGALGVEIPGVGHGFATEAPDLFDAAIAPVIARADACRENVSWI